MRSPRSCSVSFALSSVPLLFAAGAAHATGGGTVVAWGCGGGNDFGQCRVPSGLAEVDAIAAGAAQSLALKSDGTVVAWGCGGVQGPISGQCSVPADLIGVTAIAAGSAHSLALKSDGTVVAFGCAGVFGNPDFGQCSVPAGLAAQSFGRAGIGSGRGSRTTTARR